MTVARSLTALGWTVTGATAIFLGVLALNACGSPPEIRREVYAVDVAAEVVQQAALSYLEHQHPSDPVKADIKLASAGVTSTLAAATAAIKSGDDAAIASAIAAADAAMADLSALLK